MAALLYVALYGAAAAPGLPFGFRLFGHRNPAGWVAGALIGYALTCLAIWAAIHSGNPSTIVIAGVWLLVTAAAWILLRPGPAPLIPLAPWTRADAVAYALVMVLTAAVAIPPFLKLGSRDSQGNRYYRAYFTADFVWHTALTAEVGKFSMPPRNPFLRNRSIHYYWTYFLVPAAVSTTGPAPVRDVEQCLKVNAVLTGMLFISMLFMSVRAAVPAPAAVAVSVALALIASSAEGWARIHQIWSEGSSLETLRQTNIDAVTAWVWHGLRVDGLQRAIWYNPQHSTSGALGLIALTAAAAGGSAATWLSGAIVGLALAGSVMMNPFVGALFALAYGVTAVLTTVHTTVQHESTRAADQHRSTRPLARIAYSAVAVIPVGAALYWCNANQMVEGAGGALQFGLSGPSRHSPLLTLMLSLGPALVPAVAGVFVRGALPFAAFIPAALLAAVSLFLMYFVRLSVDEYWVGFRTGHLLLLTLPALAARFFERAFRSTRALAAASVAVVALAGAPTFFIDAFNAQDLTNFEIGPGGFPWTRVVTPQEQQAWRWIRELTPRDAVVQQDALARDPTTWWTVPTFGQRRMAAGMPPFMISVPEYLQKSERVRAMYASADPAEALAIARSLRIDYIYVDAVERQAYPQGVLKFDDPRYFTPAFRNDAVAIFRVQ